MADDRSKEDKLKAAREMGRGGTSDESSPGTGSEQDADKSNVGRPREAPAEPVRDSDG